MAEFPALPLFTDAYLGDTTHLTTFEHGAYLLLLMVAWRSPGCSLPDDDVLLSRYTRTTRDKWRKLRPTMLEFFAIREGRWHQARLQDEFQHLQSRRDQQVKAGNASAAAKALKRGGRRRTDVVTPLQRGANEVATPTPTPTPIGSSVAKATSQARGARAAVERPPDVEERVWQDFGRLRREKRASLTQTGLAGIQREAVKAGWSLNDALAECCKRGWQSFKAEWVNDQQSGRNGQSNIRGPRPDPAVDMWLAAERELRGQSGNFEGGFGDQLSLPPGKPS